MTFYASVLCLHVTAVLVMSAILGCDFLTLLHLRRASTMAEAHAWIDPFPKLPVLAGASLLVILLSGVYLALPAAAPGKAWPKVAVGSLFLMAPFGVMTGKRMQAIRKAYRETKVMSPELLGQLRDPFLKRSLAIRIATFLGIFLLVSAKPGLWASIGLVGSAMLIGFLSSSRRGDQAADHVSTFPDTW
jgi:hypothetical protein